MEFSGGKGPNVKKFQRANDEDFRRRVTERAGRRMRRKRARENEKKKYLSSQSHFEGMSSDDEDQDAEIKKAEDEKGEG